jgi:hypothetical protein
VREVNTHTAAAVHSLLYSTECKAMLKQQQAACSVMSKRSAAASVHSLAQLPAMARCALSASLHVCCTSTRRAEHTPLRQLTPTALHSAHTPVSSAAAAAAAAVTASTRAYMRGTVLLQLHTTACAKDVCTNALRLGATI